MSDPAGVNSFGARHRTRPQPKARHRTRSTSSAVPAARPNREAGRAAGSGPTVRGDYEVGYGKPPMRTQFKPGQSGNPKGRPRGSKNWRTLAREALDDQATVRIGGRKRRLSHRELGVRKQVQKMIAIGDHKSFQTLMQMDEEEAAARAGDGSVPTPTPLSPEDRNQLKQYLDLLRGQTSGPTEDD